MSHMSQSESLRVVHLIKGLGPGGAERLIVNQLLTSSPEIDSAVFRLITEKSHLVEEVIAAGASTEVIPGGRFWPVALQKKLRAAAPDIVHAHSPVMAVAARLLKATKRLDAAVVTTEHNRWQRHHGLTRAANRLTARLDSARIAVSEDVRNSMDERLHASTIVLDHGVPLDSLRQLRDKRREMRPRLLGERSESAVTIGIVANFRPEKAYDVFLAAVKVAIQQQPDLRFFVIGQGPGEKDFRAQVAAEKLDSSVEVLGYRDDATEVMTAFDIFTLSSRHEGKPVALMEAFALGIPVVATRAGGIPEAVTPGVDGLLVDIGDHEALAAAWLDLAHDREKRIAMGQAAGASAAGFDASAATKSIESLYRSLIE